MSFYGGHGGTAAAGGAFSSSFSTPESGRWDLQLQPPGTPTLHQPRRQGQDILAVNQKLDRIMAVIVDQKDIIEKSQKETAELQKRVSELGDKLNDVQMCMQSVSVRSKKKSLIPKDLCFFVKNLHSKRAPDKMFKGSQAFRSPHNLSVQESVLADVKDKFSGTYSPARLKRSIHRYYESRRRLFNDSQPNRREKAQQTRGKSRKTANQKKLYEKRKKFLKGEEEEAKWAAISLNYMTEESETEGDEIRQHTLQWRSEELNKLIRRINRRIEKTPVKGSIKPKKRVQATPSSARPPPSYPEWAVQKECGPQFTPSPPPEDLSRSYSSDSDDLY